MSDVASLLQVYQTKDNYRTSPYFICEGRWLVETLLKSAYQIHSIVIIEGKHQDLRAQISDGLPVISITQDEANALLGFHFHRGILAAGLRPPLRRLRDWALSDPANLADPHPWIIAPELADPSNVGALIRNAAGLGASALITGNSGASPWYRKAIRASAGNVFRLPVITSPLLEQDLRWIREQSEIEIVALALTPQAVNLRDYAPSTRKIALMVGPEDHGLSSHWQNLCHHTIKIPMSLGVDSLNVATSAAIALNHFSNLQNQKSDYS